MSRKFFTPPQPSPNPRGGSKKFTNDIAILNDSTRYQAEPGNADPEALPRL